MRRLYFGALLLALGSTACGPQGRGAKTPAGQAQPPLSPVAVSEEAFATEAQRVLVSGAPSAERSNLLAGLVRRQLHRAAARFDEGQREAGLRALTGAFYLTRLGELRPEMLVGGGPALKAGADEHARVGDDGRAETLYGLLRGVLPPSQERDDVEAHLRAIARWRTDTSAPGTAQYQGTRQRAAVGRALLVGTGKTLEAAREELFGWIRQSMTISSREAPITSPFERDEAIEAYRALRAGAASVVAVYLRHGDPRAALDALRQGGLLEGVPQGLRERLERAASDNDPQAWMDLFRLFDGAADDDGEGAALDRSLAEGAAWGTAVELYRSSPAELRAAAPLALLLVRYGMPDAAPPVLTAALGEHPTSEDLSFCLGLLLRSLAADDARGDAASAARTFSAAGPLLGRAEQPGLTAGVRPSSGQLRYVMAAIAVRAGQLREGLTHARAAIAREPTAEAVLLLANVQRQLGELDEARRGYAESVRLCQRTSDLGCQVEAELGAFELERDAGQPGVAEQALGRALTSALQLQRQASAPAAQARAERLLARLLDHYGQRAASRAATRRAFDASRGEPQQFSATALDAARRALVQGDLTAARGALERAVEVNLGDEDLVYAALWVLLTERRLGITPDGSVASALARVSDEGTWVGHLAAWGRRKLDDAGLRAAARSEVQRIEADFYVAMARSRQGQPPPAELCEVAKSGGIELVEVGVARDLCAKPLSPTLPSDARLP